MERFDLALLRPGSRDSFALPVMRLPDGNDLWLPVLAAAGQADGPTLAVLAGVHGDEYEGIRAIPQIFRALDLVQLRGRLIMVPVCNIPAYRTATRSSPIDGLNLARVFPGDVRGTVTQRIAHTEITCQRCSSRAGGRILTDADGRAEHARVQVRPSALRLERKDVHLAGPVRFQDRFP